MLYKTAGQCTPGFHHDKLEAWYPTRSCDWAYWACELPNVLTSKHGNMEDISLHEVADLWNEVHDHEITDQQLLIYDLMIKHLVLQLQSPGVIPRCYPKALWQGNRVLSKSHLNTRPGSWKELAYMCHAMHTLLQTSSNASQHVHQGAWYQVADQPWVKGICIVHASTYLYKISHSASVTTHLFNCGFDSASGVKHPYLWNTLLLFVA